MMLQADMQAGADKPRHVSEQQPEQLVSQQPLHAAQCSPHLGDYCGAHNAIQSLDKWLCLL